MPLLYRRKPDVVEAVRWYPGRSVPGVEFRATGKPRRLSPGVFTTAGWLPIYAGQWVLTDAEGLRSVLSDEWFRAAYEPVGC